MARRLELHSWDGLPQTAERGRSWALVGGDCVEALEKLPPHSVDVAFADPPYMLSNGGTTCQSGRRVSVDKGSWDASRGVSGDHAFQSRWLQAVRRVLKPSGTLWVSGTQHVIFSIGFALAYAYAVMQNVTLFRYYPLIDKFSLTDLADRTIGPAMTWYGWIAYGLIGGVVLSVIGSVIVPRRFIDRLWPGVYCLIPLIMLWAGWVRERDWFLK